MNIKEKWDRGVENYKISLRAEKLRKRLEEKRLTLEIARYKILLDEIEEYLDKH